MSSSKSGWPNWGDHPIVVIITVISALIAIFVFLTGKQDLPSTLSTNNETATLAATSHSTPSSTDISQSTILPNPTSDGLTDAIINTNKANLRGGPGKEYASLGVYAYGTPVHIIGKVITEDWLQVELPDGKIGWIFSELLQINIALSDISGVTVPAISTPRPDKPTAIPQPTQLVDTPPGTILEIEQTWRQVGAELTLKKVDVAPNHLLFFFYFTNRKSQTISIRFSEDDNFHANDNRGQRLKLCFFMNGCQHYTGQYVIAPGDTQFIEPNNGGGLLVTISTSDPDLTEVVMKITNISSISEAAWRVPIYH